MTPKNQTPLTPPLGLVPKAEPPKKRRSRAKPKPAPKPKDDE